MLMTAAVKLAVCEQRAVSLPYKDPRNPVMQGKDVLELNRRCFSDKRKVSDLLSGCSIDYSLTMHALVDRARGLRGLVY